MGFTQKFLSSPACRQRWLQRPGSARRERLWVMEEASIAYGAVGGTRTFHPVAVWSLRGFPPAAGRAEAPQGLLAPQAGISRRKPVWQSQGPAAGNPARTVPAAWLAPAFGGEGVSGVCKVSGACPLLGGFWDIGCISPCRCSSGLCEIHKIFVSSFGKNPVSCRSRELLLGMVSQAEHPAWLSQLFPGETALLPSCLSSSKGSRSPGKLFFCLFDTFGWFCVAADPEPRRAALARVSSARPGRGDPVAGSGGCCPWACAVPAAPAAGAGALGAAQRPPVTAGGDAWLGWGRRDP